jgi:hypothetical protein
MPFDIMLTHASVRDMFRIAYPTGSPLTAPAENFDPGRFRNKAFFDAMYGDCRKGEVTRNLVSVVWLPKHWGTKSKSRASTAWPTACAISPSRSMRCLTRSGRQRGRSPAPMPAAASRMQWPALHACLWRGDRSQPRIFQLLALGRGQNSPAHPWRNRMPKHIVDAFERHGFIWGGRWYHYDTMHFEYRPELLGLAPAPAPR